MYQYFILFYGWIMLHCWAHHLAFAVWERKMVAGEDPVFSATGEGCEVDSCRLPLCSLLRGHIKADPQARAGEPGLVHQKLGSSSSIWPKPHLDWLEQRPVPWLGSLRDSVLTFVSTCRESAWAWVWHKGKQGSCNPTWNKWVMWNPEAVFDW